MPALNEAINVLYAKRGQTATHLSAASFEAETNKAEPNEAEANKAEAKKPQPIDTVIHLAGVAHVGQAHAPAPRGRHRLDGSPCRWAEVS